MVGNSVHRDRRTDDYAGRGPTVVAGGMEIFQAPHVLRGARDGWKLGRSPPVEDYMMTNLQDMTCGIHGTNE